MSRISGFIKGENAFVQARSGLGHSHVEVPHKPPLARARFALPDFGYGLAGSGRAARH